MSLKIKVYDSPRKPNLSEEGKRAEVCRLYQQTSVLERLEKQARDNEALHAARVRNNAKGPSEFNPETTGNFLPATNERITDIIISLAEVHNRLQRIEDQFTAFSDFIYNLQD